MSARMSTIAGAALALCLAVPAQADEPTADTVVARVNDTEITLGHMIIVAQRLPEQFQQLPDEQLFDGILDQLVEQTALADTAGEPDRRTRILLETTQRELIANSLLSQTADAALDDDALETAYAARYLEAEPEQEFSAAHILVETEDLAEELRAELAEGADFAELAQEHSQDPGSAGEGGNLGWFGAGMMVEPFEQAVMDLEPGEVSDPVETQFGWHLIRLDETRDAEVPELDAVRDELTREVREQAVFAHIQEVREAADIELMVEGIDRGLFRDPSLLDD